MNKIIIGLLIIGVLLVNGCVDFDSGEMYCPLDKNFVQAQEEIALCHKQICEQNNDTYNGIIITKEECTEICKESGFLFGCSKTILDYESYYDTVKCVHGTYPFEMCDFIDLNALKKGINNRKLKIELGL